MPRDIDALLRLKRELDTIPAVKIEEAAEVLKISLRTMYRRRSDFKYVKRKNHLYITKQSLQQYIEDERAEGGI